MFLLAALCQQIPAIAAAEAWPVKDFEVFIGGPTGSSDGEELTPTIPMTAELKAEIEAYLGHVAEQLEDTGFKSPYLEPVVQAADGRPAFRVYYFDFTKETHGTDAPAARLSSSCGQLSPSLWLNGKKFLDGGELSPRDYQDLGHEVFHGVQARYSLFTEHCAEGPGAWISEGTAQAVGADLAAWSARRVNYPHRTAESWPAFRWGLRTYDLPMFVGTPADRTELDLGYGASSFWRYLGEHVATHGGAGTEIVKPDYSYLIDFFSTNLEKPVSEGGSMVWLDQQLRNENGNFILGLNRMYANFITTFAAYGGTRVNPTNRTPAVNREKWLENTFHRNRCTKFFLDQDNLNFAWGLAIAPVAAECFRVGWPRGNSQNLQVRVSGLLKERLQALTLGTEDGGVVADPILVQDGEGWNATWIINLASGTEPVEMILSNVAANPRYTRQFQGRIEFSIPATQNNLVPQGPMPPPPSTQNSTSAINSATQAARVAGQIDSSLDELNPNTVQGIGIARNPQQATCEDAFVDISCGPMTTIHLEYIPGSFGSLETSTGRGGAFGQFSSALSGIAAGDVNATSERSVAAIKRAENIPGTHVTISIPLIDYGFTGTFNNASLHVNAGNDQTYRSLGPEDIQPGPGRRYPFAGVVTIEEYTPWQVRGSYSGDLTNVDILNLVGDDPSMPIHQRIAGTFNIVAAWRKDDRMIVETAETAIASVYADMREMNAGLDVDNASAMPGPQQQSASSSSSQGGSLNAACDCSCNAKVELTEQCEMQCAPTVAACAGVKATAQSILFVPPSISANEAAKEPFLRSIPNACDVLDETAAMSLLATATLKPSGPREWMPKVTSQCGYGSTANAKARTDLTMMFTPLAVVDSYTMTKDEMRAKAGGFSELMGVRVVFIQGLGNYAFGFVGEKVVSLKVYTGIYGTAMDSDELITELVLTYTLTDSQQADADKLKKLYDLSRLQVELLKQKSLSTHEGT